MQRIVYSKEVNKSVTANMKKKGEKMKKLLSFLSIMALSLVMSIPCFAETIGDSSGNPPTGVSLNWVPFVICGAALAAAVVMFIVMNIKKNKK